MAARQGQRDDPRDRPGKKTFMPVDAYNDIIQSTLRQYQATARRDHSGGNVSFVPNTDSTGCDALASVSDSGYKTTSSTDSSNNNASDNANRRRTIRGENALDAMVKNSIQQYQNIVPRPSPGSLFSNARGKKNISNAMLEHVYPARTPRQEAPYARADDSQVHPVSSDSDSFRSDEVFKAMGKRSRPPHSGDFDHASKFMKKGPFKARDSPQPNVISDNGSSGSASAATLSDTGSSTSTSDNAKPDTAKLPEPAESVVSDLKEDPAKTEEDPMDGKTELERRRELSRISSRRSRERERQRLDYWRGEKEQLKESTQKLHKENELLKELIQKIKADISLRSIQSALVANLTGIVFK